jgi:hypothetical protein
VTLAAGARLHPSEIPSAIGACGTDHLCRAGFDTSNVLAIIELLGIRDTKDTKDTGTSVFVLSCFRDERRTHRSVLFR